MYKRLNIDQFIDLMEIYKNILWEGDELSTREIAKFCFSQSRVQVQLSGGQFDTFYKLCEYFGNFQKNWKAF